MASRKNKRDNYSKDVLEHLEQGIALVNSASKVLLSNRKFERLALKCFGVEQSSVLSHHIRNMGSRNRAVVRIGEDPNAQSFLTIKTLKIRKSRFYLLTLHRKRIRRIDLFKVLQSEYKVSLEQFRIIAYLSKGYNNNEIAQFCNLKVCNVKYYLSHLYDQFYVTNRTELVNKMKEIENKVF